MPAPDDSYETIYDDVTGEPVYRPIEPVPPVGEIVSAWDVQQDAAAADTKDNDTLWPDGSGEVKDIGLPLVSVNGSDKPVALVQTYNGAEDLL